MNNHFDVIVIGGGHAGIEASCAAARMGSRTALVTMDSSTIGRLSCNPSIGGSAKGHLAKEVDALGGVMPFIADRSGIQFKLLNRSKGPAIWSPRSQNDKDLYPRFAQELLSTINNLFILNLTIEEILVKNDCVVGVKSSDGEILFSKRVVLCGGTFLNGVMHTGLKQTDGGRVGEQRANKISDLLESSGIKRGRLKTGTPPRVDIKSIDFSKTEPHNGDFDATPFSHRSRAIRNTLACWATKTSLQTHELLAKGFDRSPMFIGRIQGSGPRYCPSIEDKVNRFSDKDSHIIVLEPEGLNTESVYVNGFSTSLPIDVQEEALHSIDGLQNATFIKYGYAVEYDFFFPYQLKYTLETKAISGLYFAGQINGTSGYEEAASQGLIAGINAALSLKEMEPFVLSRSESYIGVMIDDLVNKSTEEPYRVFTSLAEYRLLLRQDNADSRLMKYGHSFGLISNRAFEKVQTRDKRVQEFKAFFDTNKIKAADINPFLEQNNESTVIETTPLSAIVKRGQINLYSLTNHLKSNTSLLEEFYSEDETRRTEIEIKYEGYIQRQSKEIEFFKQNEERRIPTKFDYDKVTSLSKEGREKLKTILPQSLGQASRIQGVSASDIAILTIYLKS